MFSAVFKALKRIFDMTLAPLFLATAALLIEWFLGGVSWIIVAAGNVVILIFASLLAAIPFPPVTINADSFGSKFLDLASIINLWAAIAVYIFGSVSHFITKILTFGVVGK